jgi:hypothetical protein
MLKKEIANLNIKSEVGTYLREMNKNRNIIAEPDHGTVVINYIKEQDVLAQRAQRLINKS